MLMYIVQRTEKGSPKTLVNSKIWTHKLWAFCVIEVHEIMLFTQFKFYFALYMYNTEEPFLTLSGQRLLSY